MQDDAPSPLLEAMVGQVVVIDLTSPYVCLGKLVSLDRDFLQVRDADFHDFRDNPATREVYVYNSARVGIRRNRASVLVRRSEVVAVTLFSDIAAS